MRQSSPVLLNGKYILDAVISLSPNYRQSRIWSARLAVLFVMQSLSVTTVQAQDRTAAWGTLGSYSGIDHSGSAVTAVITAQGRTAILPGASITSIGVVNEITVVGDNNLLNSTQEGTNSGDVTSTVTVTR
ncbi:hypothetical protein SAMN05877838_0004 [Hoeflea halophila]|uniref:Uncharacterized protein n=1 Tax=Hoeflea halophila TaxID=714899 RepID=A0A286HKG8_9HYPH|nr:hypothetical protein SAMN05877838_0004 [Hoeflea halophila]